MANDNSGIDLNGDRVGDMAYADEVVLMDEEVNGVERMCTPLLEIGSRVGLECNQDKSKAILMSRTNTLDDVLQLGGRAVQTVDSFKYIGSLISSSNSMEEEVKAKIVAGTCFINSLGQIFKSRNISR